MDFEDPVASTTAGVGAPHRLGRPRHDVPLGGGPGDLLVRELSDQMACDVAAPPKALSTGSLDGGVEQLGAGDVGVVLEVVTPGLPYPGQGIAEGVFVRIVA